MSEALLVTSTGWGLAPEVLLVIFLQCQYLLRQLSVIRATRMGDATWSRLEVLAGDLKLTQRVYIKKINIYVCMYVRYIYIFRKRINSFQLI